MSASEYRKQHDLTVQGQGPQDVVPEPLQTFEAAGFPPDILSQVSHVITACF